MSTFLFDDIIFGPVKSRRLGISLGVNLVPVSRKICTYNCIYCECGWTSKRQIPARGFPERSIVKEYLSHRLVELADQENYANANAQAKEMTASGEGAAPHTASPADASRLPDAITFAGNGEPTLHPDFQGIIEDTIKVRNSLSPESQIAVLSNCSLARLESVRRALIRVDRNILKLDTGIERTFRLLNQPPENLKLSDIVENLKMFPVNIEGTREKLILQTLFLRGTYKGDQVDNTTETELKMLLALYDEIRPLEVQVYTIARDTPVSGLEKIPESELTGIAARIGESGIKASVFG